MRKFLASVGNAQLLGKVGGTFQHIADVRTLTDSTLSFSNSMDEIRAGEGAQLYGRFSHDAGMTIQLTDAMFDLNYIALQVGAAIEGNATAFFSETLAPETVDNVKKVTLSATPATIGTACGLDKVVVWFRATGCDTSNDKDQWRAVVLDSASTIVPVPSELSAETSVCVRYFVTKPEARQVTVKANFIPAELVLILTTKLFAGDANAPETGKEVGYITVKIPRFQLDGQFDLSMAMSSPSSMSLNGTALAVPDGSCEGAGVYAEIVEIDANTEAITGLKDVVISTDSTVSGVTVYGLYADGHLSTLASDIAKPAEGNPDAIALGTIGSTAYTLAITFNGTTSVTAVVNAGATPTNMTDTFTF